MTTITRDSKSHSGLTRRSFVAGSAGLTFAFAAGSFMTARTDAAVAAGSGGQVSELG